MTADKLHPKDVLKKTIEGFKKQAQGRIKTIETEVLTKDKKRVPVSISTAPVYISGKEYMFGIFRRIKKRSKGT